MQTSQQGNIVITSHAAQTVIPIIGDPVAQVATPVLWNTHFAETGQDAICIPVHLKAAGLPAFVEWVRHAENVPGFLSTIPHKADLPALCEHRRDEVEMLGVANTVRKNADGSLECAMFDGTGMIAAIETAGAVIAGGAVLIVGSGAAGSAIALEALKRGATKIVLLDRDQALADNMAQQLRQRYPGQVIETKAAGTGQFTALINASPLGNAPDDPYPYSLDTCDPATVIADAVTEPAPTKWLADAAARGLLTVNGSAMAAAQADLMRRFMGLA